MLIIALAMVFLAYAPQEGASAGAKSQFAQASVWAEEDAVCAGVDEASCEEASLLQVNIGEHLQANATKEYRATMNDEYISRGVFDIVIPTYEEDLCQFNLAVSGLMKYAKGVHEIIAPWVSSRPLADFIDQAYCPAPHCRMYEFEGLPTRDGWRRQIKAKLEAVINVSQLDQVIVVDSKNVLLREFDLIHDHYALASVMPVQMPVGKLEVPHKKWTQRAASLLNVRLDQDLLMPFSVTPVLLNSSIARAMEQHLEKIFPPAQRPGISALDHALFDLHGTEFALYHVYERAVLGIKHPPHWFPWRTDSIPGWNITYNTGPEIHGAMEFSNATVSLWRNEKLMRPDGDWPRARKWMEHQTAAAALGRPECFFLGYHRGQFRPIFKDAYLAAGLNWSPICQAPGSEALNSTKLSIGAPSLSKYGVGTAGYVAITHHKSGTMKTATETMIDLCCPDAKGTSFWQIWSHKCKKQCAKQNVFFYANGLSLSNRPWNKKFMQGLESVPDTVIAHHVRNPVDMVVSGYLYHKHCDSEPQWLDVDLRFVQESMANNLSSFFLRFPAKMKEFRAELPTMRNLTYCRALQKLPAAAGIKAEVIRTLGAGDGVAGMLSDFKKLQAVKRQGFHVATSCLGSSSESDVSEAQDPAHFTSVADDTDMRMLCQAAQAELIAQGVFDEIQALNFTCPSYKCSF